MIVLLKKQKNRIQQKTNKMNKLFVLLISFIFLYYFSACEGDCYDEQIEKVEWETTYINKTRDTLVSYSVTKNEREYLSRYDEIKHTLTLRNNNSKYKGRFKVKIIYGVDNYFGFDTEEFDEVEIRPNSSQTFTLYTQAGKYLNYNSEYYITQRPVSFSYKEKKDELKREMITVNRCEENVEALIEKYKIIEELFNSKPKEKARILD